jgi:hypothetical protein
MVLPCSSYRVPGYLCPAYTFQATQRDRVSPLATVLRNVYAQHSILVGPGRRLVQFCWDGGVRANLIFYPDADSSRSRHLFAVHGLLVF